MNSSWVKPASAMKAPHKRKASIEESEEMIDQADQAEIQSKIAKTPEDQIGQIVNGNRYFTNWTFPILNIPEMGPQMSVSRFYPEVFVAVDIFKHIGEHEKKIIAAKRQAFKNNKVTYGHDTKRARYGALEWSDPLANLLPQLED